MREQVAAQEYGARVFQTEKALDGDQRSLDRDAVVNVMSENVSRQLVRVPRDVVESGVSDSVLRFIVRRDSVVVKNGDADYGEQRQRDEVGMAREEGGGLGKAVWEVVHLPRFYIGAARAFNWEMADSHLNAEARRRGESQRGECRGRREGGADY